MFRRVFGAMGTVVSVGTDVELSEGVWEAARAVFWGLEQRFSLFRPTSELCVHNSGLVPGMVHSPGFEAMWAAGRWWQDATGGAFCVQRPGGGLDLNGIVKAHAVAEVGRLLDGHGVGCWIVNAGGDVLTSTRGPQGRPWRVGVTDPECRGRMCGFVEAGGPWRAVATSGVAERGEHIWRVGEGRVLGQVTVVAEDIVVADVLATAVVAAGPEVVGEWEEKFGVRIFCKEKGGSTVGEHSEPRELFA